MNIIMSMIITTITNITMNTMRIADAMNMSTITNMMSTVDAMITTMSIIMIMTITMSTADAMITTTSIIMNMSITTSMSTNITMIIADVGMTIMITIMQMMYLTVGEWSRYRQ